MTDPKELLAAKEAATVRLTAVDLRRWHLRRVDRRLEQYCKTVIQKPAEHCVWELLAVERFLRMCDTYGLRIDYVKIFFRFYESMQFPGATGPTRYKLTPVQCFQFASIFGFWRPDGRRVVREAVLFVPRKFSKTTSSAAFAVWDLIFGDANAESYTAANSSDQAKKCFDAIRTVVRGLDPSARRFIVNEQVIKSVGRERSARAQCLTANARTKDGLNASTVIMDEFSQARDATLLTVLTTSMGVRENPLTIIITTASDVFEGPFYDMLQGYKRVLLGEFEDDSVFAHLFEPDPGDEEGDPATWAKVHPHLGITVQKDYYAAQWAAAQRNGAEALLAFRTKLLNIYSAPQNKTWISRELAEKCSKQFGAEIWTRTSVAMLGIDLSKCDDFTAITTAIYDKETARMRMKTDYFFPAEALTGHPNEELYRKWIEDGWLQVIPGPTITYEPLAEHIRDVARRIPVMGIGFDSAGAVDLANNLRAYGFGAVLFPIPQAYSYFKGPVFFLEKGMREGNIEVEYNPITLWCFTNCVLDEDYSGNFKPIKKSQSQKIDGVITMLMAARQYMYWKR